MREITEALTKRTVSAVLTTECRKIILNFDATMEASMLIRTTKASMGSSTLISSLRRVGGTLKTTATVTKTTLSRTSTEGTLQTGLMQLTLQPKTSKTKKTIMISCRNTPRTRS
jgi:hypothetical protein